MYVCRHLIEKIFKGVSPSATVSQWGDKLLEFFKIFHTWWEWRFFSPPRFIILNTNLLVSDCVFLCYSSFADLLITPALTVHRNCNNTDLQRLHVITVAAFIKTRWITEKGQIVDLCVTASYCIVLHSTYHNHFSFKRRVIIVTTIRASVSPAWIVSSVRTKQYHLCVAFLKLIPTSKSEAGTQTASAPHHFDICKPYILSRDNYRGTLLDLTYFLTDLHDCNMHILGVTLHIYLKFVLYSE